MVDLYEVLTGTVDGVNYRVFGRNLADRHFDQVLLPVGYDFELVLALFNAHCADVRVPPISDYYAMSDEQGALWGGFADRIAELAPWQGPEYAMNEEGWTYVQREATAAWLAAHPGYSYQAEIDRRNRNSTKVLERELHERNAVMTLFHQTRQLNKLAYKVWHTRCKWKRDLLKKQMRQLLVEAEQKASETSYAVHKVSVEPRMRSGRVGRENLIMDENHVAFQLYGYDPKYEALRPRTARTKRRNANL